MSKERIRRVEALARTALVAGKSLFDLPTFRQKVAAMMVQLKAIEVMQLRVVANQANQQNGGLDPTSSILKLKGAEIQQAIAELLMDVVGPYALPYASEQDLDLTSEPPIGHHWETTIAPDYFNARKFSIYGGSDEIQKNIIAKAVLGLNFD